MDPAALFERLSKRLKSPEEVQSFLRKIPYNREENGETCRSAATALAKNSIHCLEGALIAAAILERKGYPPLVMNFDSVDNLCHVIFVYQKKSGWGSIGRSRDEGLHGRRPVYKSLRDLARSYIDPFVDYTGRVTGFLVINLDDTSTDWRGSKRNVWKLERHLVETKHQPLNCSDARYKRLLARYIAGHRVVQHRHWR